jgi:8-oxo-dGTP diphosphatase
MPYTYEYPRPMVTVDMIVHRKNKANQPEVLLIERGKEPYQGMWALPGGFVDMDEDLEDAAHRELMEETGIKVELFSQFSTYGKPGRDPRGRTVSIVFMTDIKDENPVLKAGDDASNARWFSMQALPELAFDHTHILEEFLKCGFNLPCLSG